ncbi:MAG: RNA polymerase sigma factor [candidate division WOR-3 bacterium]|nr:MAG: RNA polymerase sigma factor [candidate division WOR-3 bacterium]
MKKELPGEVLNDMVAQAKDGNDASLSELCEYIYGRIYSFVYYRVNHREDAEDLTGDIVMKIIRSLDRQKGNFHAWMYRIARNVVIDFYRRRGVRKEVSLADVHDEPVDERSRIGDGVLTRDKLRQGLKELTAEQQEVIILRFIEEYSTEEVAARMKKSVGAVKLLQFRAIRALRRYLRKKGYEIKS